MNSLQVKLNDALNSLHGRLDGHAMKYDNLAKMMDDMPDHNTVMKGGDDLLASHLADHGGKMSAAINKLPLPPDEKVLPNAIENSLEARLRQTLTAIKKLKPDTRDQMEFLSLVQGMFDEHSRSVHGKLENHAKKYDNLSQMMNQVLSDLSTIAVAPHHHPQDNQPTTINSTTSHSHHHHHHFQGPSLTVATVTAINQTTTCH